MRSATYSPDVRSAETILIALALAGCSLERGEGEFAPQSFDDVDAPADSSGPDDVAFGTGSGAGTMAGTWLQVHEASTCVLVEEQVTAATYLVQIEQDGRTLRETRTQCEVSLSEVFGLQITVPDAVLDSIEFIDVDRGYVSALGESGTYASSTELSLWGVDLEDPLTDDVPTEPDEAAVTDGDDDGMPGVTFKVVGSQCERYIAQRTVVRYFGTFTMPNQIDGTSTTVTDSNVLESSMPLCGISPRITPNDQHSKFRMVRIDGAGESINLDEDGDGTITCAEAMPFAADVLQRRDSDGANCE